MLESEVRVRGWIRRLESKVRVDDWSGRLESMVSCQTTAVFDSSSFLFCRRFLQGYLFFFAAVFILLLFFFNAVLGCSRFHFAYIFWGRFFSLQFFRQHFRFAAVFYAVAFISNNLNLIFRYFNIIFV